MKNLASFRKPTSVVHVVSTYPPFLGGMEKVVQILTKIQAKHGLNVSVITSDQGTNGSLLVESLKITRLKSRVIANTTVMPALLPNLLKLDRNTVVHVHFTQAYTPEVVWLASKIKQFKYVAHMHLDVPPSGPFGFLLKLYKPLVLKRVLQGAAVAVVFTEEQKLKMHQQYSVALDKIRVIPNGVEDKFYHDTPRTMNAKPRLLFVGRLGYQKNLPQLLNALEGVSDQFETTLVGDGNQEAQLKQLAADLKLENITFAGRNDGEALLRFFKESDIFVLASEREGMPLVLLEAMAMGLPIVATNVTGNRDVVTDGENGLLVPYNDADAMRSALLELKSDPTLYQNLSKTSRKMADQYSWEKISATFEQLYGHNLKILSVVSSGYEQGGAETTVASYNQTLRSLGYEVKTISSNSRPELKHFSDYEFNTIPTKGLRAFIYTIFNPSAYQVTKRVLNEFQPDVVVLNTMQQVTPSVLVAVRHYPTIQAVHGPEAFTTSLLPWHMNQSNFKNADYDLKKLTSAGKLRYFLLRHVYVPAYKFGFRNINRYLAFSSFTSSMLITDGFTTKPISSVPIGIKLPRLTNNVETKPHTIAFVGRLEKFKGVMDLIDAMPEVLATLPEARLELAGDGSYLPELQERIEQLGLKPSITFKGHLSQEETANLMAEATVLVMPSTWPETFGKVGIEAMSLGTPVIATDVGGVRDWLKDNYNGLLVTPGNPEKLASTVIGVLRNSGLRKRLSKNALISAQGFTTESFTQNLLKAVHQTIMIKRPVTNKLPSLLLLAALALANASWFMNDIIGSTITLCFFLLVPGYLLLDALKHDLKSRWEIASFSLGLSLLLLMLGGLGLNSLHAFGLARPLSTLNIFGTLDVITLGLVALNWRKKLALRLPKVTASGEELGFAAALTLLPLLAMGGAIRLNNGASNVLTMVTFGAIAALFMLLIWRKHLSSLYPYAVFTMGLAVLFSTSLRGWGITGHDIQHEFKVFQITLSNQYWNSTFPKGDPYNACLSITILPTLIAKLTAISSAYVYKVVFQVVYALGLVPIYLLVKRFVSEQSALMASLLFISFPPFLNDMPFLNRQEIAFVFFGLLLLTNFMEMAKKPKTVLTLLFALGLILSHYSSNYVTLGLMILSWPIFKLLTYKKPRLQAFTLPMLSLPVILTALLATLIWNTQVTKSTSILQRTVTNTVESLFGHHSSVQSTGVSYSLFSAPVLSPNKVLASHAGSKAPQVQYLPEVNLPLTNLGKIVSGLISINGLNAALRGLSAKILQILLIIGAGLYFLRQLMKKQVKETYLYALSVSSIILLVLMTVLPQLSVDYSVTRLFQQTLVITSVPIVLAIEFLLRFMGRFKGYAAAAFIALLFLDLSGFVPQALGGYPPQLALNNSGTYYDIYYTHNSERLSYSWLSAQSNGEEVTMDSYAQSRLTQSPINAWIINPLSPQAQESTYIYQDYSNTHSGSYGDYIDGDVIQYSYLNLTQNATLVYANQSSRIYEPTLTSNEGAKK